MFRVAVSVLGDCSNPMAMETVWPFWKARLQTWTVSTYCQRSRAIKTLERTMSQTKKLYVAKANVITKVIYPAERTK